ncbi:MAG: hypothetical protein JWQ27_3200 [Ferruginibacter sp.]|nr:hypothetical protein [Ferruginibacter sp.]
MTAKSYLKIAIGWTIFLALLTVVFVSTNTSAGGEQILFTSVVKSIIAFFIGQLIIFIIYLIKHPKDHFR